MRKAFWTLLLPTILLGGVLSLSGCSGQSTRMGGKTNPKVYERIVSLSPSTTELAGLNLNVSKLKGRTAACNYPVMVSSAPVVADVKPDYEKLALVKPDLVFYDGDLYNAQDIQKIEQLGVKTFKSSALTIDDFLKDIYRIGSLLGNETGISTYADRVYNARAQSLANKPAREIKVALVIPGQNSEHMIVGTGAFQGDVIRAAGATPVGPTADRFVPLKVEDLIAANPDFIFTSGKKEPILADPRLKTVKAVATKRVIALNPDVALRRGGRVDKLIETIHAQIVGTEAGK
ncbi:MAG: ABC transporter substrate-binding protein [Fimbriimonas sp.]